VIFGRRRAAARAQREALEPHAGDGTTSRDGTDQDAPARTEHAADHPDGRSGGLRITEGLLPIFGPAQVGDSTAPLRPATEAERSRDRALRTTLTRVVGADGKSYVVAVPDEQAGAQTNEPDAGEPTA
jgi:hypothetical protein